MANAPETAQEAEQRIHEEKLEEMYVEEPTYGMEEPGQEGDEPGDDVRITNESGEVVDWTNEHFAYGQTFGLTPDQVRNFGTPENFETVMTNMSATPGVDPAREAIQEQVAIDNPGSARPKVEGDFEFEDADLYDESILGMNQHNNDRFAQMEERLRQMEDLNQRLQGDAAAREFDTICDTLDGEIFGEGRLDSLDENLAMNRVKLANEVSRQGHGYQVRGEALPPLDDLVQKSYHAIWGGDIRNRTLRGVSERSKERSTQTSAIPTSRESDPLSPEERAVQAAAMWHQEHGTNVSHDNDFAG